MIVLSGADVAKLLRMPDAIELVEKAMIATSNGEATLPLRHAMDVGGPNKLGIMPGAMQDPACYGTKLISLFPENPAKGYSSHLGLMVLFDQEFGQPTAIMNAGSLTAIRTAAASAVATRALARPEANTVAIIGTGEQALIHIEAMKAVRDITEVSIAGRTQESADKFALQVRDKHSDLSVIASTSVEDAAKGAQIICTVTSSSTTVLQGAWVDAGCHVNAVGASIPTMREVDEELLQKSSLYVDYRPSAFAQAGDIVEALQNGTFTKGHVRGEIGEVLQGKVDGRQADEITLYRSLGIAAQDLICAHHVMEAAKAKGVGTSAQIL